MIHVERVEAAMVLPLRGAILRPGLPLAQAAYPEDDDPANLHLAALDESGHVVGCCTWLPEPWEGRPAWRLRGMATDPGVRGSGVGGALIRRGLDEAVVAGAEVAWCNARTVALGFYRHFGFETVGEEFLTQQQISHYVMWCELGQVRSSG